MDFDMLFAIGLVIGEVALITVAALFVTVMAAVFLNNFSSWFAHARQVLVSLLHRARNPSSASSH